MKLVASMGISVVNHFISIFLGSMSLRIVVQDNLVHFEVYGSSNRNFSGQGLWSTCPLSKSAVLVPEILALGCVLASQTRVFQGAVSLQTKAGLS